MAAVIDVNPLQLEAPRISSYVISLLYYDRGGLAAPRQLPGGSDASGSGTQYRYSGARRTYLPARVREEFIPRSPGSNACG